MSIPTIEDDGALLDGLRSRTVAIVGYGNQGTAHALNLRDAGLDVVVGARRGEHGWSAAGARALDDGFDVLPVSDAAARGDLVVVALPDEHHGRAFESAIAPGLRPGSTLGFIHGFSIRYGLVRPPASIGVVMVAPKGPGTTLRQRFLDGGGIPCLFAVHQESESNEARRMGLAWAAGLGCARARIVESSFADETETDLFGEQAVLCGGMSELILAAFEILVEAGYPPELAYVECCHEVKQVADLVYTRGLAGMRDAISNTAEYGAYRAGRQVIDGDVRDRLRAILHEIRDGTFAREMLSDRSRGFPWFEEQRRLGAAHDIEAAGATVRGWMGFGAPGREGAAPSAPSPPAPEDGPDDSPRTTSR